MNCFHCPRFWESKVKRRFPSLEIWWVNDTSNHLWMPSPPPDFYKDYLVLNEAKNWAEGNSYLVSNSIQNWGQYFSSRFLLFGREKEWAASASSCGHTDPSSLRLSSQGKCSQVRRTKSSRKLQREESSKVVSTGCHFDPQLIWQHQLGFSCSNYVTY